MKNPFLLAAFLLFNTLLFAQDEEPATQARFFFGGNFGLSFGNYTVVNLSPQVGYRFNKTLSAGVGLNLQYASLKQEDALGRDYSKTAQGIAGLNVFGRVFPLQNIFFQVQPEANYIFGRIKFYQPTEQTYKMNAEIVPCLLLGAGAAFPAGRGTFLTTVLYDVMQRPASPYGNQPFVNFGYNVPF